MNWSSGSDFMAMGGYGLYVWGSFGMAALVVVAEVWQLAARRRELARTPRRTQPVDTGVPHEA